MGWSPIHPTIASGSKNGTILIWNLENYLDQTKGFCTGGDAKDESKKAKPDVPHSRVCKQVSASAYPKTETRKAASQEERSQDRDRSRNSAHEQGESEDYDMQEENDSDD